MLAAHQPASATGTVNQNISGASAEIQDSGKQM